MEEVPELGLTRITKENHGRDITCVKFCPFEGSRHLVGTCGANQVSTYDTAHRGNFMDVVHIYVNPISPNTPKSRMVEEITRKEMRSLCWMTGRDKDLYIVAGGNDGKMHVLSLVWSKCLFQIPVSDTGILELETHPSRSSDIVLSINGNKKVQLWDIPNKKCLQTLDCVSSCVAFNWQGSRLIAVAQHQTLREYEWKSRDDSKTEYTEARSCQYSYKSQKLVSQTPVVSACRYLDENTVVIGVNDSIQVINLNTNETLRKLTIRNMDSTNPCHFDVSEDKRKVVCGNGDGSIYVYDLVTGACLVTLDNRRSKGKSFSYAAFVPGPHKSILVSSECLLWKWDEEELVKDFFPTSSFFDNTSVFKSKDSKSVLIS